MKRLFASIALVSFLSAPTFAQDNPGESRLQEVNVPDLTEKDALIAIRAASEHKVAIVIWGGNRTLQYEAWLAANDLVANGIPAAIVIARDHNSLSGGAVMQIWSSSLNRTNGAMGIDNAHLVRADLRRAALNWYCRDFPEPRCEDFRQRGLIP